MLVTLSGLDGAGKSTVGKALKERLERSGMAVTFCHMNQQIGLYATARIVRDLLLSMIGKRPSRPIGAPPPHGSGRAPTGGVKGLLLEIRRRIIWNKPLRKLVDLVDLAIFTIYRFVVERVRGRILIMDRYFYDRMADQADGKNWGYIRWFARLSPVPDLPVFVDVPPTETFARKGEYSVESMTRRRDYYQHVFQWVPSSVVLPNDILDQTVDALERLVMTRLPMVMGDELAAPRR